MENGWIKLYRRSKEKGYWKNSKHVHLWIHLLLLANHKEEEFMWNKQLFKVSPGQILTGRSKLAIDTKIRPSTIENILKTFENEHQIKQQKTTKFRLITIVNWDKYQQEEQQKQQQSDNRVTTDEQQNGHKQEVKSLKNLKEDALKILKDKDYPSNTEGEFNQEPNHEKTFPVFMSFYPRSVDDYGAVLACAEWGKINPVNGQAKKIIEGIVNQIKFNKVKKFPLPHIWLAEEAWDYHLKNESVDDLSKIKQFCWLKCTKESFNCAECGKLWGQLK